MKRGWALRADEAASLEWEDIKLEESTDGTNRKYLLLAKKDIVRLFTANYLFYELIHSFV